MPKPSRAPNGMIEYKGTFIPANTPMKTVNFRNPDGTITSVQKPVMSNRDAAIYRETTDRQYAAAHPNAPAHTTDPSVGLAIRKSIGEGRRYTEADLQNQQSNYSKVNGFGRNNKNRTR